MSTAAAVPFIHERGRMGVAVPFSRLREKMPAGRMRAALDGASTATIKNALTPTPLPQAAEGLKLALVPLPGAAGLHQIPQLPKQFTKRMRRFVAVAFVDRVTNQLSQVLPVGTRKFVEQVR